MLENQKKVASQKVVTGHNAGRRHVTFALKSVAEKYQKLPVRKLSKPETARLLTLEECLEELTAMQSVSDLRLKRVLLEHEYSEYNENYMSQKEYEKYITDKTDEIIEYEVKLNLASFYYNKGEGYSTKGKHSAARKSFSKADIYFEILYEYLEVITTCDPSLWIHFDRTVTFDAENYPALVPESAPRFITSKSHYNTNKHSPITRNKCKISATEKAILSLKYESNKRNNEQSDYTSKKLNDILNKQFDDDYM